VVPTDISHQESHHEAARLTVAHSPLTVTSLIPPQSSAVVRVAFSPKVEKNFTSLLLLRYTMSVWYIRIWEPFVFLRPKKVKFSCRARIIGVLILQQLAAAIEHEFVRDSDKWHSCST